MADYFLDSSALVKRYIKETGSIWVNSLFDPAADNEIFAASITCVEIVAAITRRARGKTITAAEAASTCHQIRTDWAYDYQTVELNDIVLNEALRLAESYGLRGYDAVQLAAGVQVNYLCVNNRLAPIVFVSADGDLNAAAIQEGLVVIDPNSCP